ncbi:MAG: ATP-binding protein [Blastocatellia bacterium]|nr:ATP-binding protein [Blastocatellia bacterium]
MKEAHEPPQIAEHPAAFTIRGREVSEWEWQQERRNAAERFQRSGCPVRAVDWVKAYRRGECKSERDDWARHLESVQRALCGSGATFALVSEQRGTGKTTLATAAARHVCEQGASVKFQRAAFLSSRIRASFQREARENEHGINLELLKPRLLIVDEMGERKESEWENQMLTNLLCARHDEAKDSILIANQDAATFTAAVGESIADRMHEAGGIIEFRWPSFRTRHEQT